MRKIKFYPHVTKHNLQISLLLFVAIWILQIFGIIAGYLNDTMLMGTAILAINSAVYLISIYLLLWTRLSAKEIAGDYAYMICNITSHACMYWLVNCCPHIHWSVSYIILIALLLGGVDALWLLHPKVARIIGAYSVIWGWVIIMFSPIPTTERIIVGAIFIAVALWKLVNSIQQAILHQHISDVSKYQAFRETVVTLNHEFNNVSTIILASICSLEKDFSDRKDVGALKYGVTKIVNLIKQISKVKEYSSKSYAGGTVMADIEPKD